MDQTPLVMEEIDAGDALIREFDHYKSIKVAFWLKRSEDEFRYLYLASEDVQDADIKPAYREVLRITRATPSPYLDPFRVKVIRADDPRAQAALDIQTQFPATLPTRLGRRMFGGAFADDVYIYPPRKPLTAELNSIGH